MNFQRQLNKSDKERGAILVMTALVMLLLLLISAFATDLGAWYRQGQEQQRAADVGATNGVLAYDSAVKAYFDSKGVENWEQLNDADQLEAEAIGLQASAQTIIGLLETSGLTFSSTGDIVSTADPLEVTGVSTYRVVADDGTTVTIVRSFVANGEDSAGNTVYGRSIRVELVAPGEQYFSNIIRDAPEIERAASSTLSNCAADCSQDLTLTPPLKGFNASGSGDGYRPMIDLETERVWLINHLWDSNDVGAVNSNGWQYNALGWQQIVCMDAREQATCDNWAPLDKEFYGSYIPDEAIDLDRGRLYYGGMGQSVAPNASGRRTGNCERTNFQSAGAPNQNVAPSSRYWVRNNCEFFVACVDTINRGHCAPTKISDDAWGGGPWFINDKVWAVSANGNIFCIEPDSIGSSDPWCSGYGSNGRTTVASGNVNHQWSHYVRAIVTGDVVDADGDKLVIYHGMSNVFHCWDTSTNNNCAGFGLRNAGNDYGNPSYYLYGSRFHRYDTSGNIIGWCMSRANGYVAAGAMQHTCVNENGSVSSNPIPNLVLSQGSALTWSQYVTSTSRTGEVKMYFQNYAGIRNTLNSGNTPAGGGLINCYDWVTQNMCNQVDAGNDYDFYAFTEFTRECLVGVGDVSRFYSFSSVTGGPCSSAEVQEEIEPCECSGSDEKRWGSITLPTDFSSLLHSAYVFILNDAGQVIDPSTGAVVGGVPGPLHSVAHDIVNDGTLSLEGLNGIYNDPLQLLAIVDGKLATDGTLAWKEPKAIRYELVVQPTLVD